MLSTLPPKGTQTTKKINALIHSLPCKSVTPWKSHPNRYWSKDGLKFITLLLKANANQAELYLVNYATDGLGRGADEIKVINVQAIDPQKGIEGKDTCLTRRDFETWYKKLTVTRNVL